ncbi:hypothetical protein BDZ88DRAFT_406725 [Geranomyces variabilis]|nr:hypothetical protein BDZ88DRAFT_406725 [Geranomyces variabilis]
MGGDRGRRSEKKASRSRRMQTQKNGSDSDFSIFPTGRHHSRRARSSDKRRAEQSRFRTSDLAVSFKIASEDHYAMTPKPRPPDEVAQALEAWVAFLSPSPTVLAQSRHGAQAAAERLCQPKLAPIWDHLTRRVTSSRRANQIRNLLQAECENAEALDMSPKLRAYRDHTRQKTLATRELRERKEALQKALAEAKAEREMRMRECAQLTSKVAATASHNSAAKAAINETQQRACLVRAQRRDVAQDIQIVRKYSRMLKHFGNANGRGDERQHTSLHVHAVKVKEMCLQLEQELTRSEMNLHEERSSADKNLRFTGPPDHMWKALIMQLEEVFKQEKTASSPITPLDWPAFWKQEMKRHLGVCSCMRTQYSRYQYCLNVVISSSAPQLVTSAGIKKHRNCSRPQKRTKLVSQSCCRE